MDFIKLSAKIIILRCNQILMQKGIIDAMRTFPFLQEAAALDDEMMKSWAEEKGEEAERYFALLELAGAEDDNVVRSFLDLAIAVRLFPDLPLFLEKNFGMGVCLQLSYLVEGISCPGQADIDDRLDKISKLCHVNRKSADLLTQALFIDERVMGYLYGLDGINPLLADFTQLFDEDTPLHKPFILKDIIDSGTEFFKNGGKVLQLSGKGGRRFIAGHISRKLGKRFLFLNIADFFREAKDRLDLLRGALIREALLSDAGICFYGLTYNFLKEGVSGQKYQRNVELMERLLFLPIISGDIPVIICSDDSSFIVPSLSLSDYYLAELPTRLKYDEKLRLWKGFEKEYGLKLDCESFASVYNLNASETAAVLEGFLERKKLSGRIKSISSDDEMLISRIALHITGEETPAGTGFISFPATRLSEVKVKKETMDALKNVIAAVNLSHTVYDEWKLMEKFPYGRGISVLLAGGPGTGKTMSANAIACELHMPLFQVNLSNIVDKYIGETEKNLEKAFLFAEKTNAVLFFDEADSLFGKRSEIKDSKDKYANTEVSYLLQRIERFDGIVIMASNIKGNIDPAFMRRIRYMINFENPDEEMRRQIWESCIGDDIPHDEIDYEYLASQFDFTGSVIKSCILNACTLAAAGSGVLDMSYMVTAVKEEMKKTSTVAFTDDRIGKYAFLVRHE